MHRCSLRTGFRRGRKKVSEQSEPTSAKLRNLEREVFTAGRNSFYSTSRLIHVIARKGNVVTTSVLKDFHNKTLSYFDLSNARDIEDASEERALQV